MTLSTMPRSASEIIRARVDQLELDWMPRKDIVAKWYKLIRLENDLAQDNMESVIGNDPRSSYNLAAWLLTPKTWSIRSFKDGLSDEEISQATAFEQLVEREVMLSIRGTRGRIRGSYLAQAVKMFVATGWICLVAAPDAPRWTINAWNPMTAFPGYSGDGVMEELGRKYTLPAGKANVLVFMEGWIPPTNPFVNSVIIRQWWVQMPEGVFMAVVMNNHIARPLSLTMFDTMPIYCQPAGGLPDDGSIVGNKWRADAGQAIVGAVMDLQKNYDRMLTYMQQILRDTANPKWIERISAGGGIIKPEDLNKRGVVWTLGLGEDAWPVQPPGPPVDLRTHGFDLRNQTQRGTFQDASFGGGEASAFLMANITDSTKQILQPFLDGIRDANGELFTRTAALARKLNLMIGGARVLDAPDDISLDFHYDIEIPGDFLQRANSARILNPNFRLSQETITDLQFPEVQSAFDEQLRLTNEDVLQSPAFLAVKSIRELRRSAAQASLAGDGESEAFLLQLADRQQAQLLGEVDTQGEAQTFRDIVEAGI